MYEAQRAILNRRKALPCAKRRVKPVVAVTLWEFLFTNLLPLRIVLVSRTEKKRMKKHSSSKTMLN
jgi:hypothetical protein